MADYQYIIDQIKAFVAAADQTKTPQLVELASEYAALCNEVNNRLRKCQDYIRRGLRAEAVHLAEEHPVLLEMISALDLTDQPEWANFCAMYELTPPPPLLVEAAQELNETYSASKPLEVMLDRHRRLALECAPLSERLAVMRELEVADPASAFWDADIRAHEVASIKKMKAEATAAFKQRDLATISRVLADLNAGGWRVEPPPELRAALQEKAEKSLTQQDALHQVRLMMRELDLAYSAMSLSGVTECVRKIRELLAKSEPSLPADLNARLVSAEQWSREQAESACRNAAIEEAIGNLTQSILENAPLTELELLKDRVVDQGGIVPEEAEQHLAALRRKRDAAIAAQARRRVAMLVASMLVLLAGAGLAVRALMRHNRGNEAYATLSQSYKSGDLAAADQDLKRFAAETPYVLDRSDIKDIAARVANDQRAEVERLAKYQVALSEARESIDIATKSGRAGDADWADAISAASEANSLAKLPSEVIKARELRDEIGSTRKGLGDQSRANMEKGLKQSIADLQAKASSLAKAASAGTLAPDDLALLTTMRQATLLEATASKDEQFSQIRSDAEQVVSQLKAVAESADKHKSDADRRKTEQAELDNIRISTATPTSLEEALGRFVQRCPGSDHSPRFEKALKHFDDWQATDEAARLMGSWEPKLDIAASAIAQRQNQISAYAGKYANSPWSSSFSDYASYLRVLSTATAARCPWKGDFRAMLDAPLIKDLRCIKGVDGKRYYLKKGEVPTSGSLGKSFDFVTDKRLNLRRFSGSTEGEPEPSPQSVLGQSVATTVDATDRDWDTSGFTLADKIAESRDVDPILRAILLESALNAWTQTSIGADDTLMSIVRRVQLFQADGLPWMDPNDEDANKKRPEAEVLVAKQVPALKRARDEILSYRVDLSKRLELHIVGRGALLMDASGWTIVTGDKPASPVSAFAVTSRGWSRVGGFKDGKFAVDAASVDEDLDGSMVFFLPAPAAGSGGK